MNKDIRKVLVIGSGPVVIGQSSEYDYAGTQAIRAFKEEGIEVICVNSNAASVMTDKGLADSVYIEPMNVDVLKRVIAAEKPDSILPTVGGDKGFELAQELYQNGVLDEYKCSLLCVSPELLYNLGDRNRFKQVLAEINEPSVPGKVVKNTQSALAFAGEAGLPVIVRPAFTLGGTAAEICGTYEELQTSAEKELNISLIHEILVEKCIFGWKELEFEVVRDSAGNCICVSSMENLDPVGIHTGDSIIVTPAQTLTDAETAVLRGAALNIISKLHIEGSCNIRFALKPDGSEYAVLGVDPRASRSSALISKATGYPLAYVATKVALGYKLYEIKNEISGCTTAANEPAIDYCAVKFPKWSFERFNEAERRLGTLMQSTGEVLSIGTSFELAFMKAVRSINIGLNTPALPRFKRLSDTALVKAIEQSDNERIFAVYEAVKRGMPFETLYEITKIDFWFLAKLKNIADAEKELSVDLSEDSYRRAKSIGFLDETIRELSGSQIPVKCSPGYKMVDTCAAEFDAARPYFYSSWDDDNEALMFTGDRIRGKRKVLVIGSGPVAIGQGGELDYCTVHCLKALSAMGYSTLAVNNNPEAVSTDYTYSDRLFVEPLSVEDLLHLVETERPWGVVVQFAGEKALEIAKALDSTPVKFLGLNRELMERINNSKTVEDTMKSLHIPYTTEKLLNATGIEVDVICDGKECLIPGISEQIEHSEVHAGDSISVCPPVTLSDKVIDTIVDYSVKTALEFRVTGMINIRFSLYDNRVYVTRVSSDSFRNIPFIGKSKGLPIIEIATRAMLGESLKTMGCGTGLFQRVGPYAVRVPVFSFEKLSGADTILGLEMKSTGEVLGIARRFEDALLKGLIASGMRIKRSGGVLVTVRNSDKPEAVMVADKFAQLDFNLYATAGTARTLNANHVPTNYVRKLHEGKPDVLDLINSNKIVYVISTSEKAQDALGDDIKIRRRSIERQIPTFTTLDTAKALALCLTQKRSLEDIELINIVEI